MLEESPHFLFDELTPTQRAQYNQSLATLQKDLAKGPRKFIPDSFVDDETSPFHTMRIGRLQKFPESYESSVAGEANWYFILAYSDSTFIHAALRRIYNRYYSWGVVCSSAIEVIRKYSPILEIGAGNGYWAHELAQHGVDIIATDNHHDLVDELAPLHPPWYCVENLDAKEAIRTHQGRTILMVWPHGYALDALEIAEEKGVSTLIIVGDKSRRYESSSITDDPFGGVNKGEDSDMMFHVRRLMAGQEGSSTRFDDHTLEGFVNRHKNVRNRWELVETFPIPNFVTTDEDEAICDCLLVYRLKLI